MSWEGRVGWCPSVVTPMQARDGLLVRVKPTAATLPAEALRAVAEATQVLGNGLIDLTNRANLQVRGLRPETVETFADVVREYGLASADPALEEVRNVAADPLGADDPAAVFDSHALARAIEAMLAETQTLRALPPKFGFLIDCSATMPVSGDHADIVLRALGDTLTIGCGGGSMLLACTPEEAPALARRLATVFLELAGPSDEPPFRMRELVAKVGETAILAEAGLAGRPSWATQATPIIDSTRLAHLDLMYAPAPADSPIGLVPFPGRDTGAVVAGVPRGRTDAATLAALADLSERHADATVRMTPWRALAFAPVNGDNAAAFLSALADLDLMTDPSDPRRRLRGPEIEPASDTPFVRPEANVP
jgi:precorrin-3B synthase